MQLKKGKAAFSSRVTFEEKERKFRLHVSQLLLRDVWVFRNSQLVVVLKGGVRCVDCTGDPEASLNSPSNCLISVIV